MSDLANRLQQLQTDAQAELAAAADARAVEALRASLFGRSGRLTLLLRGLAEEDAAERPATGKLANAVREALEAGIAARLAAVLESNVGTRLADEAIDMSAPGRPWRVGHLHPTMTVERDLREIFHAFGFEVFEGPEIETDEMNFEALNIPPDHPSRDLWDTLYVAEPGATHASRQRMARSCAPTPARSRSGRCAR